MIVRLWTLALHIEGCDPEARVFTTQAKANQVVNTLARQHVQSLLTNYHVELRALCNYAQIPYRRDLEALSDEQIFKLALAWDEPQFECVIACTSVEL